MLQMYIPIACVRLIEASPWTQRGLMSGHARLIVRQVVTFAVQTKFAKETSIKLKEAHRAMMGRGSWVEVDNVRVIESRRSDDVTKRLHLTVIAARKNGKKRDGRGTLNGDRRANRHRLDVMIPDQHHLSGRPVVQSYQVLTERLHLDRRLNPVEEAEMQDREVAEEDDRCLGYAAKKKPDLKLRPGFVVKNLTL
jgi:hypothetical protein